MVKNHKDEIENRGCKKKYMAFTVLIRGPGHSHHDPDQAPDNPSQHLKEGYKINYKSLSPFPPAPIHNPRPLAMGTASPKRIMRPSRRDSQAQLSSTQLDPQLEDQSQKKIKKSKDDPIMFRKIKEII